MVNIQLPFDEPRRLPFYLALEEWVARELPPDDYFFIWRVSPTVICGRNQEMDKEVDMAYCREAGIDVVRRKSGGGSVYADMDNFMLSYVCPGDTVTTTFSRYTTMVAEMLRGLGLEAAATGRNDVLINEKKVSGNAFYHIPGRCIAHGTMLYDFDPSVMSRAITPSRAKLESKGVKSVESRVTCLKAEGIKMPPEELGRHMVDTLCDSSLLLTDEDVRKIREIEKEYYKPEFMYRKGEMETSDMKGMEVRKGRIEGVGEVEFRLLLDADGKIERVGATGDFFLTGSLEREIFQYLRGCRLTRNSLETALTAMNPSRAIANLTTPHLIDMLLQ